ncbi:MAG: DUF1559 domain-containing protein [Fuerstiella sp.]
MQTESPLSDQLQLSSSPRGWVTVIAVGFCFVVMAAIIAPMILAARESARKTQSMNTLRNICLSIQNFQSSARGRPPIGAGIGDDGTARHGVWYRILPFFESSPVFDWVDSDHAWDDPTNAWIFRLQHNYFQNPSEARRTTKDGFGVIHYAVNQQVIGPNHSLSPDDMKTGLDQIPLCGEVAANFVPWGYPFQSRDPRLALNSTPESFGRPTGDGALFGMADGSVKWLANDADITFNTDLPPAALTVNAPPYPDRFNIEGKFESIRILNYSKSGPEPITTEMVQTAINETPNAQSLIAPGWSPTESDIDMLKSLKHMHYLVIASPESDAAMDKLVAFKQLDTIVCDRKVIRDQAK